MADTTQNSAAAPAARSAPRTLQGVVARNGADKTIRVEISFQTRHPKYGKYLTRRTALQAHDERNEAKVGDTVEIAECRPLSKTKHHRLVRVVTRGPENR